MIYDGVVTKPELNEDLLMHYGVKGMKWRRRKGKKVAKAVGKGAFAGTKKQSDAVREAHNRTSIYNLAFSKSGLHEANLRNQMAELKGQLAEENNPKKKIELSNQISEYKKLIDDWSKRRKQK